jgi:hypothetical protein
MAEWLILLLLVPAVVVPVVLLVGFAGCDRVFGLHRLPSTPPAIVSAEGKSASVITLAWTYDGSAAKFEFERTKLPEQSTDTFKAASSPYDDNNQDQGLEPETNYLYRVRAILSDGEFSEWSSDAPDVPGSTLPFETTFAWTSEEQALSRDSAGWEGFCLVQRIEASRLSKSGTLVKLTVRASSVSDASIERIYISKPDPRPGKDPYDSGADDKVTLTPFVVPANTSLPLDTVSNEPIYRMPACASC